MIISETEYYLLSELIGMKDRQLAQKAELLIFPDSHEADSEVLSDMEVLITGSSDGSDFEERLREYVEKSGREFHVTDNGMVGLA